MTLGELNPDAIHLAAHEKPAPRPFPTLPVPPVDEGKSFLSWARPVTIRSLQGMNHIGVSALPGFRSHLNI
jgi:hypothetical protein